MTLCLIPAINLPGSFYPPLASASSQHTPVHENDLDAAEQYLDEAPEGSENWELMKDIQYLNIEDLREGGEPALEKSTSARQFSKKDEQRRSTAYKLALRHDLPAAGFAKALLYRMTGERSHAPELKLDPKDFGVHESLPITGRVKLFPNPVSNLLQIRKRDLSTVKVAVYDIKGRMVKSFNFSGYQEDINVTTLISGVYILHLQDNNGHIEKKRFIVK